MAENTPSASDSSIATPTWTIDAFAAYTEARWRAEEKFQAERDRRYAEALALAADNSERALRLALSEIDARLAVLNNLRLEVVEDRAQYISHDTFDAYHARLGDRVAAVERYQTTQQGAHGGALDIRSVAFALAGLATGIGGVVLAILAR